MGKLKAEVCMKIEDCFDHNRAQEIELIWSEQWIKKNFETLYAEIEFHKLNGDRWPGREELNINGFYGGSQQVWMDMATYIEGKTCLEIGPGPCGALAGWWWIQNRIFIDPLIREYKRISLDIFKRTWYTDDIILYAQPAENLIRELLGKLDGVIICRNALDHCADPMLVLENIAAYANPGCYLLLWTDLWHLTGHDEGHRNISKDKIGFENLLKRLGFEILYSFDNMRQDGSTIEYGCRARKVIGQLPMRGIEPEVNEAVENSNLICPLVSVGLPVYNRPLFLQQALESLSKQHYKNLEIIVSDDCSPTEETRKVIRKFMESDLRIRYFRQGKNLGPVSNHRFVLEQARGDFFFWASEDDEWHEEFVEIGVKTLIDNPSYDAWCCTMNNLDSFGRIIRDYPGFSRFTTTRNKIKDIIRYLFEPEIMGKSNIFHGIFRRNALEKIVQEFFVSDVWGSDYCFNLALLTRFDLIGTDQVLHYKRVIRLSDIEMRIDPIVIDHPDRHIFPFSESGKYIRENDLAVRNTPYRLLVFLTMLLRLLIALRNDNKAFKKLEAFFRRIFYRGMRKEKSGSFPVKVCLNYNFSWPKEFNFKPEKVIVDVRWGKVDTYGIIRVPLNQIYAPLVTPTGNRLFKIEETPHYQWIKALVDGRNDRFVRAKYKEYIQTYFPEGNLAEMEDVPELVKSFQSKRDTPITIITLPPALNENADIHVVVYDGVHRSAIAKAFGHKLIECRLVLMRSMQT